MSCHCRELIMCLQDKSLVYELVKLHNDTTSDSLILKKIEENSHPLLGFSKYVTRSVSSVQLEIAMCATE